MQLLPLFSPISCCEAQIDHFRKLMVFDYKICKRAISHREHCRSCDWPVMTEEMLVIGKVARSIKERRPGGVRIVVRPVMSNKRPLRKQHFDCIRDNPFC